METQTNHEHELEEELSPHSEPIEEQFGRGGGKLGGSGVNGFPLLYPLWVEQSKPLPTMHRAAVWTVSLILKTIFLTMAVEKGRAEVKHRIMLALTLERLNYVINKSFPTLGDKPTNKERRAYEAFKNDDLMIKTIMLTFMEDELIRVFEDCRMANVFDIISSKYSTTTMHVQLLLEQYNSYKMNESNKVFDHVNKMLVMDKDPPVVENVISDNMQICTILNSLPLSWDMAVTALRATRHIENTKEGLIRMEDLSLGMQEVYMGNNHCDVMGVRSYRLNVGSTNVILTEVLYVPSMRRNRVSVLALTGKVAWKLDAPDKQLVLSNWIRVSKLQGLALYASKVDDVTILDDMVSVECRYV
ncbi:hypothetical protein EJ110_NYTH27185 [Nymphaea thermarum]|nr:hypothetical protein EJ110_NYTH27185 [Nymphaea thermarum]